MYGVEKTNCDTRDVKVALVFWNVPQRKDPDDTFYPGQCSDNKPLCKVSRSSVEK